MSSDPKIVAFIVGQTSGAGDVLAKPMFGEHGIYCQGKMVAMVRDDRMFIKPTVAGRSFAPLTAESPPYRGAKPCLLIDAELWEDGDWLTELFRRSADELPLPKLKRSPAMRSSKS